MSISQVCGVQISGIASAVPSQLESVLDQSDNFNKPDVIKICQSTGVQDRYIVDKDLCTSDLCFGAATRLLDNMRCDRTSIDTIIFVSQTPDYRLPATSSILQHRLGLSAECNAFDVNQGCSGYIYGLWLASNLIASGASNRVLLLVGDTISKLVSPKDQSTSLLFGDAGTATVLERTTTNKFVFTLGTDGAGEHNLIVPAGGFRNPSDISTSKMTERENGNIRSDENIFMNGAEIFSFTLSRVTPMIKSIFTTTKQGPEDIDYFVFHQANQFIVEFLAKKLKLPKEKVPININKFGNTSSASIPLLLTDTLKDELTEKSIKLMLCGFGVGYSWGAVHLQIGPITVPELTLI